MLATLGGRFGGWGLLMLDGNPVFVHALSNQAQHKYRIAADEKLSSGKHTITFDFEYALKARFAQRICVGLGSHSDFGALGLLISVLRLRAPDRYSPHLPGGAFFPR